jgi:outer membrane protein assembly factor BamB
MLLTSIAQGHQRGSGVATRLGATASLLLAVAAVAAPARGEDWPQWRGPRADGSSLERGLPTAWGRDRGVCWATDLPGEGHSSPIVSGGSVFVTTALGDGRERALVRLDAASGRVLWSKTVARSSDLESLHSENNHASSTPATDGRAVYTSFYESGKTHLAAVAFDGRVLWSATPLRYRAEHGYHHNPLLLGDQLILSYDQLADAAVISLDTRTGAVRWKVPLSNDQCSNVAPFPVRTGNRTLVVTVGNNETRAMDAADGRVIWKGSGPTDYCVAGPAYGAGVVFVNGGYPDHRSLGFRLDGTGAGGREAAWESRKGTTYVPSPVFHDGHFYAVNDGGLATCWEAATGQVKWQERLSGRYRASLVLTEDRLYAVNDAGTTTVFKASLLRYEEIARNDLADFVYATPALAGGRIFMRTKNRLYAVGDCTGRAEGAAPGTARRATESR